MPDNLLEPITGLSTANLEKATASSSDVLSGKTFYSGDKSLKTGSFNLGNANASPDKVLNGASFYSNNNKTLQWGNIWPYGAQTWASADPIADGTNFRIPFPVGAYLNKASSGYPEILVTGQSIQAVIKRGTVSHFFIGSDWAQSATLHCAGIVIGITDVRGTGSTYVDKSVTFNSCPDGRGIRIRISGSDIIVAADNLVSTNTMWIDYVYI